MDEELRDFLQRYSIDRSIVSGLTALQVNSYDDYIALYNEVELAGVISRFSTAGVTNKSSISRFHYSLITHFQIKQREKAVNQGLCDSNNNNSSSNSNSENESDIDESDDSNNSSNDTNDTNDSNQSIIKCDIEIDDIMNNNNNNDNNNNNTTKYNNDDNNNNHSENQFDCKDNSNSNTNSNTNSNSNNESTDESQDSDVDADLISNAPGRLNANIGLLNSSDLNNHSDICIDSNKIVDQLMKKFAIMDRSQKPDKHKIERNAIKRKLELCDYSIEQMNEEFVQISKKLDNFEMLVLKSHNFIENLIKKFNYYRLVQTRAQNLFHNWIETEYNHSKNQAYQLLQGLSFK